MFSKKNIYMTLITGLLASCAFVRQEPTSESSASWDPDVRYNNIIGGQAADLATVAYSQGNFEEAERQVVRALNQNPRHPQALLVGALLYEKLGRPNRARQYYEDLMIVGGEEMTLLGSSSGVPEKMSEIARQRLRLLTIQQSDLIINEDSTGAKVFTVTPEASARQGKSAMEEALFRREQKLSFDNTASSEADRKAVEILFTDAEKNAISRFLIIKELAERDLITKEEFLSARQANIGGLLPLTNTAPAFGIDRPIPSSSLIIERINALKEAVESRAITPREFSVERNLIIEAILPPSPRTRAPNKAPSKDILSAAKDMRKVEVIYEMNLITAKEKEKEQKAIEKYLGMNKNDSSESAPVVQAPVAETPQLVINEAPAQAPVAIQAAPIPPAAEETPMEPILSSNSGGIPNESMDTTAQPLVPAVTTPF